MSSPPPLPSDRTPRSVRSGPGFLGALLGIVFAIVGFVLMVGALLLALVVAIAALLWSLVRGRKPAPVRFHFRQATARAWRPASGRPATEDVVDVEVREIPDRR